MRTTEFITLRPLVAPQPGPLGYKFCRPVDLTTKSPMLAYAYIVTACYVSLLYAYVPSLLYAYVPSLLYAYVPSLLYAYVPSLLYAYVPSLLYPTYSLL